MSVDANRCGIFHVILYHFIYAYAALDMCLVNAFVCVHVMRTNHGILPISFLLSPIFFLYFPSLSHGFPPFSNFFPLFSPFPFVFPLFSLILPSLLSFSYPLFLFPFYHILPLSCVRGFSSIRMFLNKIVERCE